MTPLTLNVELDNQRSYPIVIGQHCIDDLAYYSPYIKCNQVCIVTNETIAPLYLQKVQSVLDPHYQVINVVLPDGESYKTSATLMIIYDALLENHFNRSCTLLALGGGVVGDMTGYAAACYQRGVNFIQVPTTLLAQVDSSVGGKTGVNHPLGKNMIGAFHQPETVIIDISVLGTLSQRELSAGIAEVIKYGLIADENFYLWLEEHLSGLLELDPNITAKAIHRSCDNKAKVVSADEKESGIRAILNLGHTFGHAIETAQGYGNWLHGEAVATGMLVALELSVLMGWVDSDELARLENLLKQAQLPTKVPASMSSAKFLELMAVDKKVINGKIRLVLLRSIGQAFVTDEVPTEMIVKAIDRCR